jgi:hypothetical protein
VAGGVSPATRRGAAEAFEAEYAAGRALAPEETLALALGNGSYLPGGRVHQGTAHQAQEYRGTI